MNTFAYVPNPIRFIDPLGLEYREFFWRHVGQGGREKYQVHHIIPRNIFNSTQNSSMLACAGMKLDDADNLIGLPRKEEHAGTRTGRYFGQAEHSTNHHGYDTAVQVALNGIANLKGNKLISTCALRKKSLQHLQETLRSALRRKKNPLMKSLGATEDQWTAIILGK